MFTGLFVRAWLILWLAPDTVLGRFLHCWMLDRPIARATRITRGQVTLFVLLSLAAVGAVWLFRAEAGPLLGLATPDIAVALAGSEVTTWLDAITGALLLAASVRWRNVLLRLPRPRLRPRRRRSKRGVRLRRLPANDDERSAARALAA